MMAQIPDSPGPVPDSPSRSSQYRYYEGFVEKKGPKDRNLEKRWAILEGDKMHYYQQKVGNRELSTQKGTRMLDMKFSPCRKYVAKSDQKLLEFVQEQALDTLQLDRNSSSTPEAKDRCRMTVKCKQGNYKIKASSAEELESLWLKVVAVSTAIMPKERDLLPGQKQMFADIVAKEMDRKGSGGGDGTPKRPQLTKSNTTIGITSTPTTPNRPNRVSLPAGGQWQDSDMYKFYPDHLKLQLPTPPPWFFHKISRDHAEQILLKNPDQGHLLIRVSESHPGEYSLSVRQDVGGIVVKHYRFRWEENTYRLLIDEQQPELSTMYDLIMFFIERSGGNLKPIQSRDPRVLKLPDNLYEHRFAQLTQGINPENGEAPYRNRLSIQRAKTVNTTTRQESTYLIPENSSTDINSVGSGSSRPNRVSLPASFNQSYPGMGGTSLPQTIPEGAPPNEFSPNRAMDRSQSVRVAGSNGYYKESDPANTGYMIMSSKKKRELLMRSQSMPDKDAYINCPHPDVNGNTGLPIRPLPAVPADGNRKRSISTSALPTGYVPEIDHNSFHSKNSQSPPSLPPRNTNTDAEFNTGFSRARTRSTPVHGNTGRSVPLPGLASEPHLRKAFDQLGIDRQ